MDSRFSNAAFAGDMPVAVEVAVHDTGADAATAAELAAELAADPTVVAAIGAPGLDRQTALGDALDALEAAASGTRNRPRKSMAAFTV